MKILFGDETVKEKHCGILDSVETKEASGDQQNEETETKEKEQVCSFY